MKKLANLIALFILVSVNVLTSVSYAQEVDGEPLFQGEGYFIDGFGDNSSDDELPFSDKKEDVSDEDIVDLPEVVEDTLPSLIDMVVDTVDEHTGEDGDKGIDEGLGENEGGNFTEGDNFEGVETERQAVIDDFSEEVENLEDSLSALDLLNLSIEPEIEIMGTCDEGEIYVPELDTCATRDEEEIVYYWTDENGRGVISIKDPDGDTFLTMMDMNLGATKSGYTNNENIRGYYYQWGNNQGVRSVASVNPSNNPTLFSTDTVDYQNYWPGHQYSGLFVYGDDVPDYWNNVSIGGIDQENFDGLWGGLGDLGDTTSIDTFWGGIKNGDTRQGPCPDGYHVPSMGEWNALITYWYNTKNTDKKSYTELNTFDDSSFRTAFLLPLAGYRKYKDSEIGSNSQGDYGRYRSSSPYGSTLHNANFLAIRSEGVYKAQTNSYARGFGASVRCFKDSSDDVETLTITFDGNGGELLGADSEGRLGQKVALGKKAQRPVDPEMEGLDFMGWFEEGSSIEYDFEELVTMGTVLYAKRDVNCDDGEEYVESEDKCYPSRAIIRDSETNEIIQINDMEWGDLNFYFVSDTGRVSHYAMMDRDIGATSNDINNSSSYGYYYQWGNNYGFSKNGTYETTGGAIDVSDKGPGNYYASKILMSTGYLTNNENMWGGVGDTTGANGAGTYLERQGPCPDGYYIPSTYDWNEMYEDWEPLSINGKEEWKSDLLLPALGGMNPDGEVLSIYKEGDFGGFWSSSIYELDKTQSHDMSFDFKDNGLYIQGKIEPMQGRAIRCFKNITPDDSMLVDVDGGKNAKIYVNSGVITKLISPSREGYTFMGWYSNPTFTLTVNENDDAPSSIYAYWLKNNTVTFISKRGPKVEPQQVVSGNTLVEPAIADFPGYDFEGWYSDEGLTQEYDFDTPVTEDITLYAKWSDYIYDYNNLNLYFISDTGEKYHYTLMDRNLGATSNDINNSSSYGYYYQWGNNYGFSGSTMVYNGSVDASSYGPNNYYNVGRFMVDGNNGWDSSDNRNLWGGVGDTTGANGVGTYLDRQGPCPDGYYIPSVYNFAEIKTNWESSSTDKSGDGFSSDILLPKSGRINGNGGLEGLGQNGYIWSSSSVPGQLRSYFIHYAGGNLSLSDSFRQFGRPIRCFKNTLDTDSLNKDNIYMNGGTTAVISVNGDEIVSLGTPLKANSVFKGWFFESNFQTEASEGDVITSSTSLYAKWECKSGYIQESGECLKSNSITFDSNGGTDVLGQTIKEGLSAERPKNPRKSGFIFDGWYEDPNFEGEEYDFNLPLTGDITLYAKWLDNGFELKDNGLYQSEDGYYIIDVDDSDYPQGCNTPGLPNPDRYCILSMPSAGGYAPYSGTIFVAPALSDIPISGGGAVDYCDNLTMGGLIWRIPGSHAGNWSSMYNNRDKLINFTAQGSEKPGHYWANNNASIPYQNCTVDGGGCGNESDSNKVLAVRCVSWNAYEVMFETNGGSVVKSRGVPINSKIIEPKSELLGYTLKGWYSDEQLAQRWNFEENRVNNDLILYAKRHVNTYTITFDMDGGTGVLIITGDYNSPIEVPSDPVKEGYTFIGWSQPIPPTMPAGDMTIKALWEINHYTITFDMDGGTGVLIITGDYNSPIEAPSDPVKEGYTFIGWSQPIPPTMPAGDMTIKALWKKNGGNWSGRGKVNLGDKNDEHGSAEDIDKGSSKGNSCLDCNQEVFDAHKWAYEHGLTQYKNISEARMDDYLNRSEMAKISSIFATDFLGREPNEGKQKFCSHYSDLWKVDAEMKFFIIQSCELGYMGYMANGVDVLQRFRPYTPISLAETSIILSRIVRGNKYAVSENKWYQGHLYAVYENGLIDDISKPFDNITRKDAYTMLYRLNSLINN